jgi:hypothetical protein
MLVIIGPSASGKSSVARELHRLALRGCPTGELAARLTSHQRERLAGHRVAQRVFVNDQSLAVLVEAVAAALRDDVADHPTEQGALAHEQTVFPVRMADPRVCPGRCGRRMRPCCAGVVPAEAQVVLEQFTASGQPSQVRDQLAGWDTAVDLTMLGLPPGLPWATIEATLRAAAP